MYFCECQFKTIKFNISEYWCLLGIEKLLYLIAVSNWIPAIWKSQFHTKPHLNHNRYKALYYQHLTINPRNPTRSLHTKWSMHPKPKHKWSNRLVSTFIFCPFVQLKCTRSPFSCNWPFLQSCYIFQLHVFYLCILDILDNVYLRLTHYKVLISFKAMVIKGTSLNINVKLLFFTLLNIGGNFDLKIILFKIV